MDIFKSFIKRNKCLIIAEAGVNHNGSLKLAKKLIKAAKEAKADAVKFQTFKTETLITENAPKAKYQIDSTGSISQYEMLKNLELSKNEFEKLINYSRKKGMMFLSTPFDIESVDLLDSLDIPLFKLGSGEITNFPLIDQVSKTGKPIILSTGMATLGEIEEVLNRINKENTILLHCVTSYPVNFNDVNLNLIQTLKNAFKVPVGFSDHTLGIEMAIAATALGSCVIEKHLTLDKGLEGPDHKASLEPKEFCQMVQSIRNVENGMGTGIKELSKEEREIKLITRKSITANFDIPKGNIITQNMLSIRRPGTGIKPKYFDTIIGKTSTKNIKAGEVLKWHMIRD